MMKGRFAVVFDLGILLVLHLIVGKEGAARFVKRSRCDPEEAYGLQVEEENVFICDRIPGQQAKANGANKAKN